MGVAAFKAEDDAPIRLHRDRPVAFHVTLERMQAEGRNPQAIQALCSIETCEDSAGLIEQIWPDATGAAALIESFQSPMPEAAYHAQV